MTLLSIPRIYGRTSKTPTPVTSRSGSPKAMNESSLVLKVSVHQVPPPPHPLHQPPPKLLLPQSPPPLQYTPPAPPPLVGSGTDFISKRAGTWLLRTRTVSATLYAPAYPAHRPKSNRLTSTVSRRRMERLPFPNRVHPEDAESSMERQLRHASERLKHSQHAMRMLGQGPLRKGVSPSCGASVGQPSDFVRTTWASLEWL